MRTQGGPDRLIGGRTGADYLDSGTGNDVVYAGDGAGDDTALAGGGSDTCYVDSGDTADSCESVNP